MSRIVGILVREVFYCLVEARRCQVHEKFHTEEKCFAGTDLISTMQNHPHPTHIQGSIDQHIHINSRSHTED